MYHVPMDAGQLHKLARALRELALDATTDASEGRPNAAETLVATDVFEHSPTTVGEIVHRTGVVQSQVSAIAAALHQAGVVAREPDPHDRRRTLIVVPSRARKVYGTDRGRRDIHEALRTYLADHGLAANAREVKQVVGLLAQLSERLGIANRPDARGR